MADEQVVTAEETAAGRTSRWEDYIDIFFSPAELYRRRAQDRVGPPLVTLLLLGVFFYFVMLPANRIIMQITTYAAFVYLLSQVAGGVAVLLHGEGLDLIRHTSFGPLRFVGHPEMDPVMSAVLRRFDLFTLWQTVLWGVGIAVIYRVSRMQAAAMAGITWMLLALPAIVMAASGFGQPPGGG
jgi:hypothetical protein